MNSDRFVGLRRSVAGLAGAFILGASLLSGSAGADTAPPRNEIDPDPTLPTQLPSNEIEPIILVCSGDIVPDGIVDVSDMLALFAAWGNKGGKEDVNGDGIVDARDLIELLAAWGACDICPECG